MYVTLLLKLLVLVRHIKIKVRKISFFDQMSSKFPIWSTILSIYLPLTLQCISLNYRLTLLKITLIDTKGILWIQVSCFLDAKHLLYAHVAKQCFWKWNTPLLPKTDSRILFLFRNIFLLPGLYSFMWVNISKRHTVIQR